MIYRIHYTVGGADDSFIVEGESIQEIREKADAELKERGGKDPWSEEI